MKQLSIPEILTLDAFQAAFVTCQERNVPLPSNIESVISSIEQYTDEELDQLAKTHQLFEAFYRAELIAPTRGEEERRQWLRSGSPNAGNNLSSVLGTTGLPADDLDQNLSESRFQDQVSTSNEKKKLDTKTLFQQYQWQKSISIRNELVKLNASLVRKIAHRISHQCSEPYEDLEQIGYLGLIRAIEHFQLNQSCSFSSFAVPYIRGEILHFLRDRATAVRIPRRWQDLQKSAQRAKDKLTREYGREPFDQEVADELKISVDEWQNIKLAGRSRMPLSLDAAVSPTNASTDEITTSSLRGEKHIEGKGKSNTFWDNLEHIGIMGAGGGFLGGMLVQLFGGGPTQLIGAAIGMWVGGAYGWWSSIKRQTNKSS